MSWDEGEGCHYIIKFVFVLLPNILQSQSQVLSFPLCGQPCVSAEEKGHCSVQSGCSPTGSITALHVSLEMGTAHVLGLLYPSEGIADGCGCFSHPAPFMEI